MCYESFGFVCPHRWAGKRGQVSCIYSESFSLSSESHLNCGKRSWEQPELLFLEPVDSMCWEGNTGMLRPQHKLRSLTGQQLALKKKCIRNDTLKLWAIAQWGFNGAALWASYKILCVYKNGASLTYTAVNTLMFHPQVLCPVQLAMPFSLADPEIKHKL